MKTALRVIGALVVLGLIALAAIILVPPRLTPPQGNLAADWKPQAGQGLYATQMADCAACHTAPGGQPFAGGRAIESPMGVIYSSNITPSRTNGIGTWTLDEFRASLVDGIGKGGVHLYPAMPYENYRKLSEEDIRAMYDYFLHEVPAVDNAVAQTRLDFPFNQRWGIRLWNWVALDKPGFHATQSDAKLARGEYLVEGPGHCAACHSPRNLIMAQDGTQTGDANFLRGGEIDGWRAPDLRGPDSKPQTWSAEDLRRYLVTGRNSQSGVAGEMGLVVEHSLQYMTPDDAGAMVSYLRQIGTNGPAPAAATTTTAVAIQGPGTERTVDRLDAAKDGTAAMLAKADPGMDLGARLYLDNCNACHFTDGRGASGVFPRLDGNSQINASTPNGLVDVILNGAQLPSTEERPQALRMPGFGNRLSDEEVAALATFLRGAWSNKAGAVSADDVAQIRKAPDERH